MWSAYVGGFRAALRRWPLAVGLWLIGGAFGLAFSLAAAAWLGMALEGSLATRTLVHELDPDVLVDLWFHHGEGLRMLAVVAAVLAVGHAVVWWWLDGVVVAAVGGDDADPWHRGAALAPVMARLYGLALLAAAAWSGAVVGPAWAALRSTREYPGAHLWEQIGAATALVWVLGMVVLVAVHDHARLRVGRSGDGAVRAYAWAARFVLRGGQRAVPLAMLLQSSAVGLLAVQAASGLVAPLPDYVGFTATLLLGQVFMLARAVMRVWFLAAQRRLQP